MQLDEFLSELQMMKRAKVGNRLKPHKIIMLLAVLDMAESGLLATNQIYFSDSLITRFRLFFNVIADEGDWCQPAPPFFHLRTSIFWNHRVKSGKEEYYASLKTSGGGKKRIIESIDYAYVDDDIYHQFTDNESRSVIRDALISQLDENTRDKIKLALHWDNPYKNRTPSIDINPYVGFTSISDLEGGYQANESFALAREAISMLADELHQRIVTQDHHKIECITDFLGRAFMLGYSGRSEADTTTPV